MSVQLAGRLIVKRVNGKKGLFPVADLETSLGVFSVKSNSLDQLDSGEYNGNFVIEQFGIKSSSWRGGSFQTIVVQVSHFEILEENESKTTRVCTSADFEAVASNTTIESPSVKPSVPTSADSVEQEECSDQHFLALLQTVFGEAEAKRVFEIYQAKTEPIKFAFDSGQTKEQKEAWYSVLVVMRKFYRFDHKQQAWFLVQE